ncbi:glycosyltransferase [Acidithiobacillus sp. AC3]
MNTHVILVNWNSLIKTRRCLRSLEDLIAAPAKVWMIDNGSEDDSASELARYLAASPLCAELVCTGVNLGFGGGCNVGIERALSEGADSIWLLNNDAVAASDALAALQARMESDPSIGAVGSVIYDLHSPKKILVWGGGRAILWAGLSTHFSHPAAEQKLDYLTGASLLLRREALARVGSFDSKSFFMYWEDTDLCLRLRAAGWKLAVADASRIWHEHSSSLGKTHPLKDYYVTRSAGAFLRKYSKVPRAAWFLGTSVRVVSRLIQGQTANWVAIRAAWYGKDFLPTQAGDNSPGQGQSRKRPILKLALESNTLQGKRAGIGHYTEQLSLALQARPDVEMRYFSWRESSAEAPKPVGLILPRRRPRQWLNKIPMGREVQLWLQQYQLQALKSHWQPDLVLGTNYVLPKSSIPSIVVVHDLSHLRYPEFHPPGRVRFLVRHLAASLWRAEMVVTDSQFSKSELLHFFPDLAGRVRVIYPGISERFWQAPTDEQLRALSVALNGESRPYLLFLSTLEPRKNISRLLQAYSMLPEPLRQEYPLVMVGQMGWQESSFAPLLEKLLARKEVIMAGYLRDELLPALYHRAHAFLYPSLYEGFGLPPVEAMACGCPVLVGNVASMPEVCGPAACYCDPLEIESITQGIQSVLNDTGGDARRELRRDLAQRYTWDDAVENFWSIFP